MDLVWFEESWVRLQVVSRILICRGYFFLGVWLEIESIVRGMNPP